MQRKNKEQGEGVGQKMNAFLPTPHALLSPSLFFFSSLPHFATDVIFAGDKRQPEMRLPPQAKLLPIFCPPEARSFARSLARSPRLENGKRKRLLRGLSLMST